MERQKELFLVWKNGEDEQYYNQYESLIDAVRSEDEGAEVFKAELTSLGSYTTVVKLLKSKKRKK